MAAMKCSAYKVAEVLSVNAIRKGGSKKGAGKLCVELHDGQRKVSVVTSYSNVAVGQRVIFAPEGSMVRGMQVLRRKEAGEWTEGMICGPLEIGLEANALFCSCIILDSSFKVGDIAPTQIPVNSPVSEAETLQRQHVDDKVTACLASEDVILACIVSDQSPSSSKPKQAQVPAHQDGKTGHTFIGEWDDEGVFFYQAFNKQIADWAVQHQRFGGPDFNPKRMTWIKPSFAWMLYRAGYGHKDKNQARILKVKLSHEAVAEILSRCKHGHGNGGSDGRVQWDPARTLLRGERDEPALSGGRAIQIGMKGDLSCYYVSNTLSICDVTSLANLMQYAHGQQPEKCLSTVQEWLACGDLPNERPYQPWCDQDVLSRLHLRG